MDTDKKMKTAGVQVLWTRLASFGQDIFYDSVHVHYLWTMLARPDNPKGTQFFSLQQAFLQSFGVTVNKISCDSEFEDFSGFYTCVGVGTDTT